MLATVFTKAVLDRWRGVTIGVLSLGALLLMAMSIYRDIDLSIYTNLPEAFLSLAGIPPDADIAALSYNAVYSSYGALVLGGIAIAMGSASIAGEERTGTIGILLGNPRSRTRVLVAKAMALVLLMVLSGVVLWLAGIVSPQILDVSVEGMHIGAFVVHLGVTSLFYGMLAVALGAWTGRTGIASGVSAGVMVASFVAVGILPLVEGWEDAARLFPSYYLASSDPLLNGVDWGHVALLGAASVALFALAVVGVNRRDLRSRSVGTSLVDTLRASPVTARVAERLAGSARVSGIAAKTASEHQGLLLIVSMLMFWVMGVLIGPIFNAIEGYAADFGDVFPDEMLALFGGGDISSPEGYYQIETFGMVTPIALMVVTIAVAAKALAGEEATRTIGMLLANPVSRSRVLAEKAATMVVFGVVVGLATFAGVAAGSWIGGLGMSYGNIAATCVLATLVGLLFGALALLLGAATGLLRLAIFVPVGAALVAHVGNAMAELNGADWGRWLPFHYYLGSDPLNNGMAWGDAAILAAVTVLLVALAFPAYARRDLRQTG
jgi:ABC-2 type transport system permease protein